MCPQMRPVSQEKAGVAGEPQPRHAEWYARREGVHVPRMPRARARKNPLGSRVSGLDGRAMGTFGSFRIRCFVEFYPGGSSGG